MRHEHEHFAQIAGEHRNMRSAMSESEARALLGRIFALRLPHSWSSLDLKRFPVANYIIFRDALENTFEASREKLRVAKAFLRAHDIDPLFMMDEEGGRVTQVSDFLPPAPSPRAISKTLLPEETGPLYTYTAKAIASLGIDMNLAPCLDVNTEPMNPIIASRSFGKTPKPVSLYGLTAFLSSRPHVALVGKHFPGHGMTTIDSHLALPVVNTSHAEMESTHLTPFIDACGVGIDGLMIGHCTYAALQSDKLPASVSKQIVNDLLRVKLGYRRLVVTDSLDMDAITASVAPDRASLLACEAGCDILLYTRYSQRFEKAFEALTKAMLHGRVSRSHVEGSLARRRAVLRRLKKRRTTPSVKEREGYLALRERVLRGAMSVTDPRKLLPIAPGRLNLVSTRPEIRARLRSRTEVVTEACSPSDQGGATLLLWLMEPLKLTYPLECLKNLVAQSGTSVIVTTYKPLIDLLPGCDISVLAYDSSPCTQNRILGRLFGRNR
jgi:beta-glucosidase-like glycosyl hydrolase